MSPPRRPDDLTDEDEELIVSLVECFTARMLIGNQAGRRLLQRVADEIGEDHGAGTIEFSARLRTSG